MPDILYWYQHIIETTINSLSFPTLSFEGFFPNTSNNKQTPTRETTTANTLLPWITRINQRDYIFIAFSALAFLFLFFTKKYWVRHHISLSKEQENMLFLSGPPYLKAYAVILNRQWGRVRQMFPITSAMMQSGRYAHTDPCTNGVPLKTPGFHICTEAIHFKMDVITFDSHISWKNI